MKKLFIVIFAVGSLSSYAFEAKVICVGGKDSGIYYAIKAIEPLNSKINEAIDSGYTQVSSPMIAPDTDDRVIACVTVSKP